MADTTFQEAQLVAELNDLLQLDHDAVAAYDLAIRSLQGQAYRDAIGAFKGDHERHIEELTRLIRDHGGVPVQIPHLPTSIFKLLVQATGALGRGDASVLLAFKTNERQSRDKYRRAAERITADPQVAVVLGRAAADEARHYAWALQELDELGFGPETTARRVESVVEIAHARMGDVIESVEREGMAAAEAMRRAAKNADANVLVAVAAAGIGFIAARMFNRR